MKIKLLFLSITALASYGSVNAQPHQAKGGVLRDSRHEIRLGVSDGLTRDIGEVFGIGLVDALVGAKRENSKSYGVYSLGYRYSIKKFRIGSDFSFSSSSSNLSFANQALPSIREYNISLIALPTVEFQYFKKGIVELYGSAAAGVDLTRTLYKNINNNANNAEPRTTTSTSFAWQFNPIAIRLGGNKVGGFLELGIGHKGFLAAGISILL